LIDGAVHFSVLVVILSLCRLQSFDLGHWIYFFDVFDLCSMNGFLGDAYDLAFYDEICF
jgi:hypothetical protein